jgi:diguanylate cyclase
VTIRIRGFERTRISLSAALFGGPFVEGKGSRVNEELSGNAPATVGGHVDPNPTDIARVTLRRLASARIRPTPENFARVYYEIAGRPASLELSAFGAKNDADVTGDGLKLHAALVLSDDGNEYRALLARLLDSRLISAIAHQTAVVEEAKLLASRLRSPHIDPSSKLIHDLRSYCAKLEVTADESLEVRAELINVLRLLVDNLAEITADDAWMKEQIENLRHVLSAADASNALREAESFLAGVAQRHRRLRHDLQTAQRALKGLIGQIIESLASFSQCSGTFSHKLEGYCERIVQSTTVYHLNDLLSEIVNETHEMRRSTDSSREQIVTAREAVEVAERRIKALEQDLAQTTQKVREDQLTGTLNRHGLQAAFVRETARARRNNIPLSVTLLDLDDFKQLNDTYGHRTGDNALLHLVKVMRESMRPHDVLCRYGGEEFLILLPETGLDEASRVITRLQRQLTRSCFLHDNRHTLITFSAGVSVWNSDETQESVIARADRALYEAKQSGKNRVQVAS